MPDLMDDLERLAERGTHADRELAVRAAVAAARTGDRRPRPWAAALVAAAVVALVVGGLVVVGSRQEEAPSVGDPVPSATLAPTTAADATTAPSTVPTTTGAATTVVPATSSTLPPQPIELLAIGDSVMLGAAPLLAEAGLTVDSAVSRQMRDMVKVVERLRANGLLGSAVVVHLGTNGPLSQETVDAFMEPLSEVPDVLVLTVRANRSWTAGNNELLRALDARPNVILVDWAVLADECPGSCFYDDGIHLRPDGQRYYAQLIVDVLGV